MPTEEGVLGRDPLAEYAASHPIEVPWIPQMPQNATSLALANSIVVCSGQGRLYGFTVYNSNTVAQFILVYDQNTVPADGANPPPVMVLTASGSSNLFMYWGSVGRWFDRGIVLCNSTTEPSKTIGAADCFFDVQYIAQED